MGDRPTRHGARPPTVDLTPVFSSLSFRLCLSLSDVFAHAPVTVTYCVLSWVEILSYLPP